MPYARQGIPVVQHAGSAVSLASQAVTLLPSFPFQHA